MKSQIKGSAIVVQDRPYIMAITHAATASDPRRGSAFPITSEEVRNLLAHATVQNLYPNKLTMTDGNGTRVSVYPATLGGGRAFAV